MNMYYRIGSLIEKKKVLSKSENLDMELIEDILQKHNSFIEYASNFDHVNAVRQLLLMGDRINKYLQERKPWAEEDATETLQNAYYSALLTLPSLSCIMPDTASEITKQYGLSIDYLLEIMMKNKEADIIIDELIKLQKNESLSVNPNIIYQRIEMVSKEEKKKEQDKDKQKHPYDNLNLIVAQIIEAKEHPDAESLYILNLNMGKEERQIVSGLKGHYTREELKGKKIVLVENMKPSKIRGIESCGMLLAGSVMAQDEKEVVILLEPNAKSKPGEKVIIENSTKSHDASESGIKAKIKDIQKSGIYVKDKKVYSPSGPLITKEGNITLDLPDNAKIH